MSASRVRRAVIPAARLGTRFPPATTATPEEMRPVVDRPAVVYVVEEASRAGLRDVLLATGRGKKSIEDQLGTAPELERALEAEGDDERDPLLESTIALQAREGGSVTALMEAPPEQVSMYGVAAVSPVDAHGTVFTGRRYDTGDRVDHLRAVVRRASERADVGPDVASLREFAARLPSGDAPA